ncbi:hypothetical protein EIP86_003557 [Pleurotus ostreatoroseus]|nr:hypothetical protein EIP86_003557 [Pleurotus ostreatoroseus]
MSEGNSKPSSSVSSLRQEGNGSTKQSNNAVGRLVRLFKRKSTSEDIQHTDIQQVYLQQEVTQQEVAQQENIQPEDTQLQDMKREEVQQEAAQQDDPSGQIIHQLSYFPTKDVSALRDALSQKSKEKYVTELREQEARSMMKLMQCLLDSKQLWDEFLHSATAEEKAVIEKKWRRMGRLLVKLAIKLEGKPKLLEVPAHYIWYSSVSVINAPSSELYRGLYDKNQDQACL